MQIEKMEDELTHNELTHWTMQQFRSHCSCLRSLNFIPVSINFSVMTPASHCERLLSSDFHFIGRAFGVPRRHTPPCVLKLLIWSWKESKSIIEWLQRSLSAYRGVCALPASEWIAFSFVLNCSRRGDIMGVKVGSVKTILGRWVNCNDKRQSRFRGEESSSPAKVSYLYQGNRSEWKKWGW